MYVHDKVALDNFGLNVNTLVQNFSFKISPSLQFLNPLGQKTYIVSKGRGFRVSHPGSMAEGNLVLWLLSQRFMPHVSLFHRFAPPILLSQRSTLHVLLSQRSMSRVLLSQRSAPHILLSQRSAPHVLLSQRSPPHVLLSQRSPPHVLLSQRSAPHVLLSQRSAPHVFYWIYLQEEILGSGWVSLC